MFPVWIIGLLCAVVAAFCSNLGMNLQKRNHLNNEKKCQEEEAEEQIREAGRSVDEGEAPPTKKAAINYAKQPLWLLGLFLVFLGSVADFVALMFAQQSLIAPLGSINMALNVVFSPLLLGEAVGKLELGAVGIICVGMVLAVVFASHVDSEHTTQELFGYFLYARFIVYTVVTVVVMAGLKYAIIRIETIKAASTPLVYAKSMKLHQFAHAALAGTMGGQSVLFAKCSGSLLRNTFSGATVMFVYPATYGVLAAMFITIYYQLKWLNDGLLLFPALYIVPVFQCFWILTSVVSGMIFFGEYADIFGRVQSAVLFPIGVLLAIVGVYILSLRETAVSVPVPTSQAHLLGQEEHGYGGTDLTAPVSEGAHGVGARPPAASWSDQWEAEFTGRKRNSTSVVFDPALEVFRIAVPPSEARQSRGLEDPVTI